jgi:hypothetical protein
MIGRAALPTIAGGVQLAAAVVVLGRPDVGLALGFLSASVPTVAEALASLELLVWALVAASVAWGMFTVLAAAAPAARVARNRFWEISVAGVGLLLLASGLAHHTSYQVSLAGGSVQEARQALGR